VAGIRDRRNGKAGVKARERQPDDEAGDLFELTDAVQRSEHGGHAADVPDETPCPTALTGSISAIPFRVPSPAPALLSTSLAPSQGTAQDEGKARATRNVRAVIALPVSRLSVSSPSRQARSMITEYLRVYSPQIFRDQQKVHPLRTGSNGCLRKQDGERRESPVIPPSATDRRSNAWDSRLRIIM
jgi:hypothetical protein